MRNIVIIVVLLLWALLGWKMCTDYTRCCTGDKIVQDAPPTPPPAEIDMCTGTVICFADNSCDPTYGDNFARYRDSLLSLVTAGKRLRITGIYNTTESYDGTSDNLGACRAESVRTSFASLGDDQIMTSGQLTVGRNAGADERIAFEVLEAKISSTDPTANAESGQTESELSAQAVIYFPFNSTNKLNDKEIETYLDQVAVSIKGTSKKVRLTGHTDDIGGAASNITLGQRRANIIADYLLGQGVLRSQIISESKGETQPVANNATEVGRAKNRRTELQII